ncbi:hypothetical protein KAFR_0C03540 [Kazachstania africana CBS 2517]|uniref:DUF726 domain-containing protein n=1 Tax=Kazachstania africana (strain ATCC 22294 / BCRC 22015 / CBS 2517 / CECT 1963 / NBRC 1671 / NRRL Y-8276) TaxID=1071382 RepID=H2ASJ6_KAZAF|nr:hypothetical protein KAFR_0C03540 [Kazachstania africana CBS 2517]CCF57346.1 hypothetical protein KAFR_0C03540 [Kazachstania africana CBS 2517]
MSDSDEDLGFQLKGLKISKCLEEDPQVADAMVVNIPISAMANEMSEVDRTSPDENSITGQISQEAVLFEVRSSDIASRHDDMSRQENINVAGTNTQTSNNAKLSEDSSSDDDDWDTVPAIASYDVYNDKGELELQPYQSSDNIQRNDTTTNKQNPNITFGYTKVAGEEQAQRSYKTNKKTAFLFEHKKVMKSLQSTDSLNETTLPTPPPEDTVDYDEFEDDVEPLDNLTPDTQLNITKLLLNDMEKFAYLGAANVLINQMCTDLATLCLCVDITSNKKLANRLHFTQKDTANWKTIILNRLYEHLDVTEEEINMIENLSLHKIQLNDLCKCLRVSQLMENPWEDHAGSEASKSEEQVPHNSSVSDTSENESKSMYSDKDKKVLHPENVKDQHQLHVDVAWTIICDLFLLLLQGSSFDARSRTLLIRFAEALNITHLEINEFEKRVTDSLDMEQSVDDQVWDEQDHMKKRRKRRKRKKMAYVGIAMVGGSLVLGLSGGLLAPVIGAGLAAGLSTIGITGATGFLTGAGGTAIVAVSSTAIGANIGAKGMSRRMGSVRTFEFIPLHNNRRVNLILTISGWIIGNDDDVRLPFSTVDPVEGDLYSLFWEPEMLKSTGQTINILASEIFTQTLQQVLGATILTALMSSIQWPMALSKLGYILDNPWSVSLDRAWAAGLILADTLMTRNLGQRPVTLVGFSLGARVIYSCLIELCKKKALGLVENVFIFGTPVVRKKEELVMARSVVSGRFVNGYSDKDWVLAYLFRATSGGFSAVMGISPVDDVEGIDNFNCTELVDGHMAYRKNMPKLLKEVNITVLAEEFAEIEETIDPEEIRKQRKLVKDLDAAHKKLSGKKKHHGWMPQWMKPKKSKWQSMVEKTVEEKEIEEIPTEELTSSSTSKTKDNGIFDHSALMQELANLKASLHEKENEKDDSDKGNKNGESTTTSDHDYKASPSGNNFQLLSAGRTILPDDDEMYRKKNMEFAFPDDV